MAWIGQLITIGLFLGVTVAFWLEQLAKVFITIQSEKTQHWWHPKTFSRINGYGEPEVSCKAKNMDCRFLLQSSALWFPVLIK